ncbi:MAG: hypothetical protein IK098_01310 [Bacteroidales bacterium]|nr:hypothetical protein [Bacteroidales bacterium]
MNHISKLILASIGLVIISCGNPAQKTSETEFMDSVTEALANDGQINLDNLQ